MQNNRAKLTSLVYALERDDAQGRYQYEPECHLLPDLGYCLLECGEAGTVGVVWLFDGFPGSSLDAARRPNMRWISYLSEALELTWRLKLAPAV